VAVDEVEAMVGEVQAMGVKVEAMVDEVQEIDEHDVEQRS